MQRDAILTITAKVNDMGTYNIRQDGCILGAPWHREKEISDYVPRSLGIGGGDYIKLKINLRTGQIIDWVPPTENDLNNETQDWDLISKSVL